MGSPMYNPPVPLDAPIPGGCLPGSLIRIQGRTLPTAQSFCINLLTSQSDDIALHINPRFTEQAIIRNSCISSSWGTEERQGPPMPIFPDQNFEILILSDPAYFKIAINGQHFTEFTHRVHPLDRVSHLRVQGDLTLTLVQIEPGTLTQTSSYAPTAPPIGVGGGYGGGLPYPTSGGGLPTPGFTMPPTVGAGGGGAYPPLPQQQPYGGYPPAQQGGGGLGGGYYPPQQPVGGGYSPQQQPMGGGGGYPPQGQGGYYNPGGAAPPPGGYYQPGGAVPPQQGGGGGGGGLMGNAGKLLAGGLAGVGLAKVANKIPGLGGGGGGGHGYPGGGGGYPGGGHSGGGGGMLGGLMGPAAALGIGGALAGKGLKKDKKKNKGMMKYALPVGGALVGGYALKKGMKGFGGHHGHHGGSSSSSSSSSEEE